VIVGAFRQSKESLDAERRERFRDEAFSVERGVIFSKPMPPHDDELLTVRRAVGTVADRLPLAAPSGRR
jgi:hypothetical protein